MKSLRLAFATLLVAYLGAQASAQGIDTVVSVRAPVVALTHARVIDGLGQSPREDQTIVLRDGCIAVLGKTSETTIPEGARVLDLTGRTVLPGLVMLHEHLYFTSRARTDAPFHLNEMEFSFPRLYLACGVTTLRTGGSIEPYTDLQLKHRIEIGQTPGPRLHLTAPYIEGKPATVAQLHQVDGPDDATRMVNYWADEGFTSFKLYMRLPRDAARAAIETAHRRGLKVTGHLGAITYREAADLGIDNLEHGFYAATDFVRGKKPDELPTGAAVQGSLAELDLDSPEVEALIKHLIAKKVALTSTLPVFEISVPGRPKMTEREVAALAPLARENYERQWANVQAARNERAVTIFKKMLALEKKFFAAGGTLVLGTDPTSYGGVIAGHGSVRAVELLVEAGLTPLEALQVATLNGAKFLGVERDTGSIEAGKLADLIVVQGNPAADISALRQIETVFKDGVGYDSAKLLEAVRGFVGVQ